MTLPSKPKNLDEAWMVITSLVEYINTLEARLNKNSRNSSKPPSSDGLARPPRTQSLREPSNRNPGAQPGHPGKHLASVDRPDEIIRKSVDCCQHCHRSLKNIRAKIERRQVFDIPPLDIFVTEYQAEIKDCSHCGRQTRAKFPEGVVGVTSYGPRLQAIALYLMNQQFVPYDRCREVFQDLFSLPLSTGTLWQITCRVDEKLEGTYEEIKNQISQSELAHFDETGMRVKGKGHWLHTASTDLFTAYGLHTSRGQKGMDALGVLPNFRGWAVHDGLASYFDYTKCKHILCNAHHQRELLWISQQEPVSWASEMKSLLTEIYKRVEDTKAAGKTKLPATLIEQYEKRYNRIIGKGLAYHKTLPPLKKRARGRRKQRPGKNLLDRLNKRQTETLMFMHNFAIPFTNNLGERDIRMNKVKEKISGCFRSLGGAEMFCRIRSYISTTRKHGGSVLEALQLAVQGLPRLPSPNPA
ncbi:MAG: IS66 family transposase [bacterium]